MKVTKEIKLPKPDLVHNNGRAKWYEYKVPVYFAKHSSGIYKKDTLVVVKKVQDKNIPNRIILDCIFQSIENKMRQGRYHDWFVK